MFFRSWPAVILLVVGSLLSACSNAPASEGPGDASGSGSVDETINTNLRDLPAAAEAPLDRVPEIVASLTVEEKIGQLLMPMVAGTSDDVSEQQAKQNLEAHGARTPSEIVAAHHLGGLIYLSENIRSADQVRALSEATQAAARQDTGIPLLISVDQEGGRVARLTDEVSAVPAAARLAGYTDEIRKLSYATGQQVQQQGINVVLAPVADVTTPGSPTFISDRSYGPDPKVVAEAVGAAIEGLQESGVAAAVKHWPGHGATSVDSHEKLPSVDVDRATWEQRERVPFAEALDHQVEVVLVGHLSMPQLDPSERPATASAALIENLLRRELGFDGVVMTDALNMGAVSAYDQGELVVESVLAGVDVVLMTPSLTVSREALEEAVASGRLSEQRLDQSVTRILRVKQRLGLLEDVG